MKKEFIKFGDWERLVFGHAPETFMIEVFFRTLLIYSLLLIVLRLLGKRMTAQASILEFSVMLTLGAIIALPMQEPSRGLLPGIIILFLVMVFQRLANWVAFKSEKAERTLHGEVSLMVKNGVLDLKEMDKAAISHEQLYSQLRLKGVRHLGQLQRVYLEAYGNLSVFYFDNPKPGLSIIPLKDHDLLHSIARLDGYVACKNCGNINKNEKEEDCDVCRHKDWVKAIDQEKEVY